jgi:hypothetical protein
MKNGFMRAGAVIGSAVIGSLAGLPAMAQSPHYTTVYGGAPAYGSPYGQGPRPLSADQVNQYENGFSGTLGRQGLGADPRHPEGPGNAVSPR